MEHHIKRAQLLIIISIAVTLVLFSIMFILITTQMGDLNKRVASIDSEVRELDERASQSFYMISQNISALGEDIDGITGATMTCAAVAKGVREAWYRLVHGVANSARHEHTSRAPPGPACDPVALHVQHVDLQGLAQIRLRIRVMDDPRDGQPHGNMEWNPGTAKYVCSKLYQFFVGLDAFAALPFGPGRYLLSAVDRGAKDDISRPVRLARGATEANAEERREVEPIHEHGQGPLSMDSADTTLCHDNGSAAQIAFPQAKGIHGQSST